MTAAFRKLYYISLLVFMLASQGFAQSTYTAQLSGVITDSSGGVVAGAKVSLTDEATNVAITAVSDERGTCVFPALPRGSSPLRVEPPTSATTERKRVVLPVSQQATLDLLVTPGEV